jgi:hypothetical protein
VTAAAPARARTHGEPRAVAPRRVALLWLAAAAISGFTLRRYLGPLDEGILMQAATRMADGQWPWRDFGWSYGPGEPLVVMALGKLFDPSLLGWRVLRVAADATAAALVWGLVREHRPRWAIAAWAAAAVTAAQPTSANPTAPALALALAAVLLATRGRPGWAGATAAAAAFWRPDVGAIAALAAAATLLVETRADAPLGGARQPRGGAAGGAGAEGRGDAVGTEGRGGGGAGAEGRGDVGRAASRSDAARRPGVRRAGVCLGVAAAGLVVLYAPFLVAAGPTRVWDALVVQASRDGEWWRLPFPDGFHGGDVKDFLTWLAPYAALLVLVLAAWHKRTVGLVVLGIGAVVYYLSRADLEHAQGLLIVTAALAALIRPKAIGAAVLVLLLAVGTANRASALFRPPDLKPFGSVRVPPREAAALPRLVARVQQLVPPGEPIYVAPRRSDLVTFSNPLIHYLTGRPNVLHRDVLLQAKPREQSQIVEALRRARLKAIVRWTAPESAKPEPNRRGRPSGSRALDDYLATEYRRDARFGDYDVLVPR